MRQQKRIAAIHDLSGLGKCSLAVALPVISATGVECNVIPTAVLSTHTGEFENYTIKDLSDQMLPIARHWSKQGVRFDGIYSGYLASPGQARLLEDVIDILTDGDTLIIIDPVMADNGEYYSNLDDHMCRAFLRLIKKAGIITPNMTEAALLTGCGYLPPPHSPEAVEDMLKRLADLGPGVVTVTGVHTADGCVGNVAYDRATGQMFEAARPTQPGVFYGTGDLFASSFASLLVRGAGLDIALETATSLVDKSVGRTVARNTPRRFGVDFEGALPDYILSVSTLFGGD